MKRKEVFNLRGREPGIPSDGLITLLLQERMHLRIVLEILEKRMRELVLVTCMSEPSTEQFRNKLPTGQCSHQQACAVPDFDDQIGAHVVERKEKKDSVLVMQLPHLR